MAYPQLPMVKLNRRARRKGRRRKYRRNQGMVASLQGNIKELWSMETLKESGWIAAGSVLTPIVSGVVKGVVNRNRAIIPEAGVMGSIVNLLSASLVATGATVFMKDTAIARLLLLGGFAGVLNDFAAENLLPAMGLGDYLTVPPGMGDYLTVPPGMGDYLTVPPGMGAYASEAEYADVEDAVTGRTRGEF